MSVFSWLLSFFIKPEKTSNVTFAEVFVNGKKSKIKFQKGDFIICQTSKGEFIISKRDLICPEKNKEIDE